MNEPKQTKSESLNLIPQAGDENVGRAIFTLVEKVIEDKEKRGLLRWWKRCYELVRNKFWKQSSNKVVLTTANLIYTHIQRVVNQLTDNNPKFDVIPEGEGSDDNVTDKYDIMQKTADYWWMENEQQPKFAKSVKKGETYGVMIEKMVFNPKLNNGQGEVETVIVDPFHFGFWPLDLTDDIQKAEAVFHYRPMTVREIKKIYGEAASEVIADEEFIDKMGEERKTVNPMGAETASGYSATIGSTVKTILSGGNQGNKSDKDKVLVVECWYRDPSSDETKENQADGTIKVTTKPKYKGGIRKIVTCNCGKVVLEDSDNPNINPNLPEELAQQTYLWDKFPFPCAPSIEDTESFWGCTALEQLYPLQAEINVTLTQIKTLKDKSARRKLINPLNSGVSNDQFTNTTGIINPTNAMEAQAIRWLEDPKAAFDLYQHLEVMKALFFLVSGAFDMDQAKFGGNEVVAFKAISALLERAAQINHDKQRNGDKLLRERGRMYIALMQNWYTEQRFISYEDSDGKKKTMPIIGKDLIVPAKLMVVSGSTLPVSVSQRRDESIALFKLQAIDDIAFLKAMGVENYMDIITRKRQGAYSELMRRIQEMGVPPQIIQYLQQVSSMDTDEFEKERKADRIPPFQVLLQQLFQQGQQQPQGPTPEEMKAQAEVGEIQAKIQESGFRNKKADAEATKTLKEIELVEQQIQSEVFNRVVKAEGVKMDWKVLEQKAAQLVSEIEAKKDDSVDRKTDRVLSHVEHMEDAKIKSDQGAYNERGLKSNNKED